MITMLMAIMTITSIMVKKENIRYTHFSRNPKIAAFLKDYGYVKEYGEGVDRMCRELEAIGLPDPVFNNNTFILKTTIMSASFKCETTENASIQNDFASIGRNDASIHDKTALIGKLKNDEKLISEMQDYAINHMTWQPQFEKVLAKAEQL